MNQTNAENMKVLDDKEAFYFYNSIGNYTGHKANSLKEFEQALFKASQNSLEFHLFREDFEKWISLSLKEEALAKKVEALRKQNITGKLLRNWLYTHVKQHNKALKKPHKVNTNAAKNRPIKPTQLTNNSLKVTT